MVNGVILNRNFLFFSTQTAVDNMPQSHKHFFYMRINNLKDICDCLYFFSIMLTFEHKKSFEMYASCVIVSVCISLSALSQC